jgi:N utilization substance protein B
MLSRRILRIKVIQALYAYFTNENSSINNAEKELFKSIDKTIDLFYFLLYFAVDLVKHADSRIEMARQKKMPTHEDLHPNTKFVDNLVVNALLNSDSFKNYINNKKLTWSEYPEIIKKFYQYLIESELYKKYMSTSVNNIDEDVKFITSIYTEGLINFEDLYFVLEEKCIYWNDDIDFVINIIAKKLKIIITEQTIIQPFKNDEDIEFIKTLLRKSILKYDDNIKLIEQFSQNWDIDRIAFMDNIIMNTAITEITEFPYIPIKVSMDEYIEIAKHYSTNNSSSFINGLLDKVIKKLKDENKIIKKGKGLIGEK